MKNKKLVVVAVALALVIALMAGIWMSTRPETNADEKNITVIVVMKDGTELVNLITTQEKYLGTVLVEEGIVIGEEGPYGLTFNTVMGEVADWNVDQSYWALYVGDEYATTGADEIALKDGGIHKLEYTIG